MATSTANAITCHSCGQPVAGRFCGNCGTEAAPREAQGSVSLLVGEFAGTTGQGYFYTLGRLLRAPVKATLELTENPAYRGYKTFFLTSSAVGIALQSFNFRRSMAAQNIPPEMQQFMELYGDYYSVVLTAFQYATVFGGFLLGYWFYRRFSKIKRTARQYFKLTCLAGGLGAILSALIAGIAIAAGPTPGPDVNIVASLAVIPIGLFGLYYGLTVQKRFWDFSLLKLILLSVALWFIVMIGVMVVSGGVVLAFIAATS